MTSYAALLIFMFLFLAVWIWLLVKAVRFLIRLFKKHVK